ncbi:hypothetical protein GLOTRDRAFT_137907 [Gloeophyllum trabeum ATCC 11539]|uniref:VCBS repeat-containing protein n=1 Tax=Gloeophyllum trabeum (strain ATCC 11539 / FP-39264 / Madison 617) TaxID=670483 RepID=S7QEB5_GLOTA|nr:uncharacterized protein GLOTRDRAFT_137907 [Gloeophyllum trabeum ATCC 11539]EPQ57643.1 hypothetical protein GLOTRDRAFT_137907 [Gloeophyllum trabeum ATCC 11539]
MTSIFAYKPVYQEGDPGNGIGGYNLKNPVDLSFAFDYNSTGKLDHIVLYRPGTGTIWILHNWRGKFTPVYQEGEPGNGIGGFNLKNPADRIFPFDYDHSGRADHLVCYRPGTGTCWILKNHRGKWSPVYHEGEPGNGIGGYNLMNPIDQGFAFDYNGSGKLDHLVWYRPGTGTVWILKNERGNFSPVYQMGEPGVGIGGYNLANPIDKGFAFDYDGSGKLDHLVWYRAGTGTIWILKNNRGKFFPVYQMGEPGIGIGGYNLANPIDKVIAFDWDGSGKLDELVLWRAGTGTIWILQRQGGNNWVPVYHQGEPGLGIGGYDLRSPADLVFAFDYRQRRTPNHLCLYRPGTGTFWILERQF